jgi:hypothetical protein
MTNTQVGQTLRKSFPHWSDKDVNELTAHILGKYGNLNRTASDNVLALLDTVIVNAMKSYSLQEIGPGLVRTMLPQELYKQNRKEQLRSQNESFEDVEAYSNLERTEKQFDLSKYKDKLERLENYVLRRCRLTPTEKDFFKFLMIVVKRDATPMSNQPNNSLNINADILDELRDEISSSGWQLSDDYFRRLLSSIREKLRNKRDDITGEMLEFIPMEDQDLLELKEFVIGLISFTPTSVIQLEAYRFTEEELGKMMWLKKLFENNGYTFDPNRFPEVYYDDFQMLDEIFRFSKNPHYVDLSKRTDDNYANVEPDALGYYIPAFASNLICTESYEGVVVLFKDRIEAFASSSKIPSGITLDSIKFVVLIHELGHWLTHWVLKGGKNWKYGYNLYPQTRRTHEALAQLIAYWASEDSKANLDTLNLLSPKDASGKIDPTQIYGGYIELTAHSKVSMLEKLTEIREFWMLKDEFMFEYLKVKDFDDIEKWIDIKNKDTKGNIEWTEENVKEAITGSVDCVENLKERLDINKLLKLAILKLEWIVISDSNNNENV